MIQESSKKYKDTGYESTVEAIYSKPECPEDEGNIFIEALPPYTCDEDELIDSYTNELTWYSRVKEIKKTVLEKRRALLSLNSIRTCLPFMEELEYQFHNALITSYRSRKLQHGEYRDGQTTRLIANTGSSTNGGICLLGYSGCGKSTAIQMLTDKYPQVISHKKDGYELQQIVYITVCCPTNSSLSVLYEEIGRAVDKALNVDRYAELIRKTNGLGKKQERVLNLIECFNIGMIILDEIQLLDFKSTKESSFESIMVLMNNTKVAMTVIGTEDAYNKMFTKLRTARRLEHYIKSSLYCDNKGFYESILQDFWRYQWFDEEVELSQELVDAFYEATHGIIALTASLYISVQDEYLKTPSDERPTIDADYVNEIVDRLYPNIKALVKDVKNPDNASALENVLAEAKYRQQRIAIDAGQEEFMASAIANKKAAIKETYIQSAIDSITNLTDKYTITDVTEVVRNIAATKEDLQDARDLTRESMNVLKNKYAKQKKPNSQVSDIDIFNDLFGDSSNQEKSY